MGYAIQGQGHKAGTLPPTGLVGEHKPPGEATSLPPEMFTKLNAQIDGLNIPADQKEVMRANAIRQILQVKALMNRITP